jgi:ATP-dependent exoDNAse (exonuclease V) beta subunit
VDAQRAQRPGGKRFGTLVHAALATIPFDATSEQVRHALAVQRRLIGALDAEVQAAAGVVEGVLSHPLWGRVKQAADQGRCRRETPVTFPLEDGTVAEGIVDLAFEEDGTWFIVDYKTDRELATEHRTDYDAQVSLYAEAIEKATGQPARPLLFWI